KEKRDEQSDECDVECRRTRRRQHARSTPAPVFLVVAAGIFGIPVALNFTRGCRRNFFSWFHRYDWAPRHKNATHGGHGCHATAEYDGDSLRHGLRTADGGRDAGGSVLRSGRVVWRTARSQHPFLEVAASVGSDGGACEGEHPDPRAANLLLG